MLRQTVIQQTVIRCLLIYRLLVSYRANLKIMSDDLAMGLVMGHIPSLNGFDYGKIFRVEECV